MLQKNIFTFAQLQVLVHGLRKGQLGVNIIATSSADSKLSAAYKHYKGRIEKVTMIQNARFGVAYENKVAGRTADGTFNADALVGAEWIDYPYFKETKSGIKLSLNYSTSDKQTKFQSFYLVDDMFMPEDKVEAMFQPSKRKGARKMSAKQVAAGVTAQDEVSVVQFDVANVVLLSTNRADAEKIFTKLRG